MWCKIRLKAAYSNAVKKPQPIVVKIHANKQAVDGKIYRTHKIMQVHAFKAAKPATATPLSKRVVIMKLTCRNAAKTSCKHSALHGLEHERSTAFYGGKIALEMAKQAPNEQPPQNKWWEKLFNKTQWGINHEDRSHPSQYIDSWLKRLKLLAQLQYPVLKTTRCTLFSAGFSYQPADFWCTGEGFFTHQLASVC